MVVRYPRWQGTVVNPVKRLLGLFTRLTRGLTLMGTNTTLTMCMTHSTHGGHRNGRTQPNQPVPTEQQEDPSLDCLHVRNTQQTVCNILLLNLHRKPLDIGELTFPINKTKMIFLLPYRPKPQDTGSQDRQDPLAHVLQFLQLAMTHL